MGPMQTSHKHVRWINGCTPVQDPNTLLRPCPLRGATSSISVCNYISAAVFKVSFHFLKEENIVENWSVGCLDEKKKIGSRHWGRGANKNVCFNSCQNHFSPDQSAKPRSIICQCQLPGMEQNKPYTAIFRIKPDIAAQTCLERQNVFYFLVYDEKQTTKNYNKTTRTLITTILIMGIEICLIAPMHFLYIVLCCSFGRFRNMVTIVQVQILC